MVEPQPSKLMMRVRFPLPAPERQIRDTRGENTRVQYSGIAGFLVPCISYLVPVFIAHIAQSVEHFLGKEEVIGSIPIMGSRIYYEWFSKITFN